MSETTEHTLTCVYCGQAYPEGAPTHGADVAVLTEHIKVCTKHPMHKLQEDFNKLRSALSAIVGTDDADALKKLLVDIPKLETVPRESRMQGIAAVEALLLTHSSCEKTTIVG